VIVLLIHPDTCQRDAIEQALTEKDFDVIAVDNTVSGIEEFHKREPEIVIIAHEPAVIDAEQFCILIRRESDVPIIAVGHNYREVTLLQILRSGGDAYLRHPSTKEIVARVRSLLRRTKPKNDTEKGKAESRFTRLHRYLLNYIPSEYLTLSWLGTLPGNFISKSSKPVSAVLIKSCWQEGPGNRVTGIPGLLVQQHIENKSGTGFQIPAQYSRAHWGPQAR